jgi:acetyltransferase
MKQKTIVLKDGTVIPVRPIQPEDKEALKRLHSRISDTSIHLRFHGSIRELSDRQASYFAQVDEEKHIALVALNPFNSKEIIAVVRFEREDNETDRAEYSAIVEDYWQGRGIGLALTNMLIDEARERGIHYFYGLVLPENRRMLNLFKDLHLPEYERNEGSTKYVEVAL